MNRVILADDQAIFRAGAARVLALEDDMRIIAQCGEAARLASTLTSFGNATVLVSAGLYPDLSVLVALLKDAGSRGVLVIERDQAIPEKMAMQFNGIVGRNVTGPELIECVRQVAKGGRSVQRSTATTVQVQDLVGARVRDRLTPKEMQIVALIVQGCKNKDIAGQLGTKEQVIKNYLRSIYDKTGVSDRLELALFTLHHRMLAEAAARAGTLLSARSG